MMETQRFLERYANTPVSSIDKEKAQANLRRIGILTTDNRIASKYAHVVVKVNANEAERKKSKQGTQK